MNTDFLPVGSRFNFLPYPHFGASKSWNFFHEAGDSFLQQELHLSCPTWLTTAHASSLIIKDARKAFICYGRYSSLVLLISYFNGFRNDSSMVWATFRSTFLFSSNCAQLQGDFVPH